jgi:quinoprotein glucose dehydrogenase
VDLTAGLGEAKPGYYFMTSAPLVAAHKAIVGGWVDDNADVDMPSGVIRAFDTASGRFAWAWDMGRPDRTGAPPPGETYTRSTPNAWGPLSADEALGLAYVPLGNPSPDFWGGRRRPFDEHYGSSVVALDLATGRPRWSFQMAHHDLWDYDTPSQPTLIDLPIGGRIVPALVQSTKQGELFVLDRRTGQPLTRVAEKPVPQGAAPGDHVSPTQPFSVGMPTLRLPVLQERDMWGVTPIDAMVCRIRFRQARYDGPFTPPSPDHETLTFPGSMGVTDWGGVSIDPVRHLLIANISAISYRTRLVPRAQAPKWLDVDPVHGVHPKPGDPPIDYWYNPQVGTPFALHTRPFLGPLGVPCTRPPWGRMVAIDLATRKEVWSRTIGTARDSGPMGYPTGLPIPMGTPNIGGTLVTQGGLVFFGGTLDRYLRAYSVADGRELWRSRLSAGAQAGPMSYVTKDGRQLVVVAAGGHIGLQTKLGDAIIAYGLPAPRR